MTAVSQISLPRTQARPAVGKISPKRILMVVVFPAPLGPRNPKISPSSTWRVRSLRATVTRALETLTNSLVRPSVWMAYAMHSLLPVPTGEPDGVHVTYRNHPGVRPDLDSYCRRIYVPVRRADPLGPAGDRIGAATRRRLDSSVYGVLLAVAVVRLCKHFPALAQSEPAASYLPIIT